MKHGPLGRRLNGETHRGNNYLLDGTDNNYVGIAGTPTVTPQVDIIDEFRVSTNNFSAEYGRNAGAIINVLTKSGTNRFHGSAYEFHRNDALDAREVFDAEDTPPLIQHTFGFTIGGPVLKDKLFFFGGYEGSRETTGESTRVVGETTQLIDFVNQTRPNSIAAQLFERFPLIRPIDCNDPSVDCTSRGLGDIGSPAAGVFERGGPDGIPDLGAISLFSPQKEEYDQWNIRIDNQFSSNDRLYGRFTRQVTASAITLVRPGVDSVGDVTEQALTISETHIFGASVVNEFRAGWNEREPNFDVRKGPLTFLPCASAAFGSPSPEATPVLEPTPISRSFLPAIPIRSPTSWDGRPEPTA